MIGKNDAQEEKNDNKGQHGIGRKFNRGKEDVSKGMMTERKETTEKRKNTDRKWKHND